MRPSFPTRLGFGQVVIAASAGSAPHPRLSRRRGGGPSFPYPVRPPLGSSVTAARRTFSARPATFASSRRRSPAPASLSSKRPGTDLYELLHPADPLDVPVPGFPSHAALVAWGARTRDLERVREAALDTLRVDEWPRQYAAMALLRALGVVVEGEDHGEDFHWIVDPHETRAVAVPRSCQMGGSLTTRILRRSTPCWSACIGAMHPSNPVAGSGSFEISSPAPFSRWTRSRRQSWRSTTSKG